MGDQIQNVMRYNRGILRLLKSPNLPAGRVRLILAGKCYIPRLNLSRWGIDVLPVLSYEYLETPLMQHADMQVLHLYCNKIMSNAVTLCKVKSLYREHIRKMACKVENLSIDFETGMQTDLHQYPKSAAYNVLILEKYAVYNPKCVDRLVLSYLEAHYICVPVRQGYVRCASCIVNKDAVVTADDGIAKALRPLGIDVLCITPGYIELPGYAYGFIGGASFKISPYQLAFTGRLDGHPDYARILRFLEKHGVKPVFLSTEPVFDMGSAVPLIEESEG